MIFGPILILLGVATGFIGAMMPLEAGWIAAGLPEFGGATFFIIFGIVAALAMTALSYFMSKKDAPSSWYLFITGILPGGLLFFGWRSVHKHLERRIEI